MLKKVVFYQKGADFPGTEVPLFVYKNGQWVKVATGTFDKKNSVIEVELDTSTEDGQLAFQSIQQNQLRGIHTTGYHEKETHNA